MEKENRALNAKVQTEQREKYIEQANMQKKMGELLENEAKMQREMDEMRQEQVRRVQELVRTGEKEREVMRVKMGEVESKSKETEQKRSAMVFEWEKERARWGLEKDHIVN